MPESWKRIDARKGLEALLIAASDGRCDAHELRLYQVIPLIQSHNFVNQKLHFIWILKAIIPFLGSFARNQLCWETLSYESVYSQKSFFLMDTGRDSFALWIAVQQFHPAHEVFWY